MASIKGSSPEEITRLYRVMRTTCEMIQERGYFVSDDRIPKDVGDFTQKYCQVTPSGNVILRKEMTMNCAREGDVSDVVVAFFLEDKKVSANQVRDCNQVARTQNAKVMILVYSDMITPIARRAITQVNNSEEIRIEPFSEDELMVNITKHELVPKHIPLSAQQKQEMLQTFRLRENQLPRMLSSDPVARHYGLARGRVVQIKRPSETAGEYVTYRLVV